MGSACGARALGMHGNIGIQRHALHRIRVAQPRQSARRLNQPISARSSRQRLTKPRSIALVLADAELLICKVDDAKCSAMTRQGDFACDASVLVQDFWLLQFVCALNALAKLPHAANMVNFGPPQTIECGLPSHIHRMLLGRPYLGYTKSVPRSAQVNHEHNATRVVIWRAVARFAFDAAPPSHDKRFGARHNASRAKATRTQHCIHLGQQPHPCAVLGRLPSVIDLVRASLE